MLQACSLYEHVYEIKHKDTRPRSLLNLGNHSVTTVDKDPCGAEGQGGDWDEKPEHWTPYLVAQFTSQALLELASSYDLGGGGSRRVGSIYPSPGTEHPTGKDTG